MRIILTVLALLLVTDMPAQAAQWASPAAACLPERAKKSEPGDGAFHQACHCPPANRCPTNWRAYFPLQYPNEPITMPRNLVTQCCEIVQPPTCPAGTQRVGQPPLNGTCNPTLVCADGTDHAGEPIPLDGKCDDEPDPCVEGLGTNCPTRCDDGSPMPPSGTCPSWVEAKHITGGQSGSCQLYTPRVRVGESFTAEIGPITFSNPDTRTSVTYKWVQPDVGWIDGGTYWITNEYPENAIVEYISGDYTIMSSGGAATPGPWGTVTECSGNESGGTWVTRIEKATGQVSHQHHN